MKKRWIILSGFVVGILFCSLVPLLLLATSAINMGADMTPGLMERTLAPWALDVSVEKRAPKTENPYAGNPTAIATGFGLYRGNCVICHGAPGVSGANLSMGIQPPAPLLGYKGDDTPDGQLFWFTRHGIRMTAMPAFGPTLTDVQIWKIVAFIRHMPDLTAQERDSLQAATAEDAPPAGAETQAPPAN